MKFDFEYLKGVEKGIKREYYENGRLKFKCEFLKNKNSWKGKDYDTNGNIIFEGEYLEGMRWNGKYYEYYDSSHIRCQG